MKRVLLLSSSALTDRILAHTGLLPGLQAHTDVNVWASSRGGLTGAHLWDGIKAVCEPLPQIRPFREFPVNQLRRLNEFAWDYKLQNPSRLSMARHIPTSDRRMVRALRYPGRWVAALNGQGWLEDRIERMMVATERSPESTRRLRQQRPDVVVSTGTFRYEEPAISAAAMRLGIPVLAFITSWDNISIKSRMVLKYDGYIVWSEQMRKELESAYPQSRRTRIYCAGAPQFDPYLDPCYWEPRERFCQRIGLRADRPIILHALGVANNIDEVPGALELARRVERGDLGDAQLIVRPHPFLHEKRIDSLFSTFGPRVVVQAHGDFSVPRNLRFQTQDDLYEAINTFRHADVVVHLSSTVAVDAALFDRPSVCLNFDPGLGKPKHQLVKEVNRVWTHYRPVAQSGAMILADNYDEVVSAVLLYLKNPALHRQERRWLVQHICQYTDRKCGLRMAEAILDFLGSTSQRGEPASVALSQSASIQ